MVWSLTTASVLGVIASLISGLVALYSLRHRNKRMALQFTVQEVALVAWSISYAIQLGYGTFSEQLFYQRITLGVAGVIPAAFLLFALAYSGHDRWLSRDRVALLAVEPLVWFLLCITNPVHHLAWTGAKLVTTPLASVTALEFGIGYLVHIGYSYSLVTLSIVILIQYATKVAPVYQKQVGLLVAGAIPPFITHIVFTLGYSPIPALDLTPFIFAFTGIVFGLALFQFDLLHLTPIAREQAFHEAGDGLLIVNNDGEIIDVLGVAAQVLTPTPRIGASLGELFPTGGLDALHDSEISVTHDGEQRVYQFQVSPVAAHHGQRVGTLVLMRDITGLYVSRQRLSVSNRVLRHNLRNDMNVVLGYASELESKLDGDEAKEARILREKVEHFFELANKAKQIENVYANTSDEGATIDLVAHLHDVVADQQTTHPDAEFTVELPLEASLTGIESNTLRLAVENLIDNAIEHNDSETPRVAITIEADEAEFRVKIADNGPGIPEIEQDAVGAERETSLNHSQGLGLWLTYWCTTRWGGDLQFEADDDGTTVILTFPKGKGSLVAI
ncbi:histidine kinase N-terminal 7TM domain-containing protein [Haloferax sp. DFSO60]|uniref:histidine kinase N-terminal 7TM domain-containing protein n=1 Tax=Haloferax sp. DFSO60 TaxID=3388652 RepID=UPI00397810E0